MRQMNEGQRGYVLLVEYALSLLLEERILG